MRSTRPCAPAAATARGDAEALAALGASLPEAHRAVTDAPPPPEAHATTRPALRPPPSAALPLATAALVFGAASAVVMLDGGTVAEAAPLALVAAALVGGSLYELRATRTPLDTQSDHDEGDEGGDHDDTMRGAGRPGELG